MEKSTEQNNQLQVDDAGLHEKQYGVMVWALLLDCCF
jgi:hypothetical protein